MFLTKFGENTTMGYGEIAETIIQSENIQRAVTPSKVIEPGRENDMHMSTLYRCFSPSFVIIQPWAMEK